MSLISVWISLLICLLQRRGTEGTNMLKFVTEDGFKLITEGTESVTNVENSSVTLPVDASNIPNREIDFGFGRACAIKITTQYSYMFEEITNEILECTCFGICPDTSDEDTKKILKSLKARNSLKNTHDDIPILVSYISVMVLGIIGNLLVIVTVRNFKSNSVTNLFICSLAVADLIVVTICVPFRIIDYVGDEIWKYGDIACKFGWYIYFCSFMCSVFTLTAMGLERYLVICRPIKSIAKSTPERAKKAIAVTWISAFVLSIPWIYASGESEEWECDSVTNQSRTFSLILQFYLVVAVFAIPCAVIGFSYVKIAFSLWKSLQNMKEMKAAYDITKNDELSLETRSRIQAIRMLILVWFMFILCWSPYLVFTSITRIVGSENLLDGADFNILFQTFNLMTIANSAMNPILYAFVSRQFRTGFAQVFMSVPCVAKRRPKAEQPKRATVIGKLDVNNAISQSATGSSPANSNDVSFKTTGSTDNVNKAALLDNHRVGM